MNLIKDIDAGIPKLTSLCTTEQAKPLLHQALVEVRMLVHAGDTETLRNGICSGFAAWAKKGYPKNPEHFTTPEEEQAYQLACAVWYDKCSKCTEVMKKMWIGWDHFSGNTMYPVPGPSSASRSPSRIENANQTYHNTTNYWIGEYGNQRINLLYWLIERTKP